MPETPKPTDQSPSAIRPKRPVRPLATNDLVLTPGGMRPRALVHELKEGQHIDLSNGRIRILDSATGAVVQDLGESSTPEGEAAADAEVPGVVPSLPDIGWIENAQWHNTGTQPIVFFTTSWVVPPAPSANDGQTVFLFNGLQPDSAAHILQPVLQWGKSAAGGGNFWSVANWYADGQGGVSIFKAPVQVSVGTKLTGFMRCTGKTAAGGFNYVSSFQNFALDVTVTGVEQLTWAYETLECYGSNFTLPLTKCTDYPATTYTRMSEIAILTGTPGGTSSEATIDWFPVTSFTSCGQACRVISNNSPGGEVDLFYPPVWQEVDSNPKGAQIVVDGGTLYQRHNDGSIWKYTGTPISGWQQLDNNPACISIAASGGQLYELHNTGRIWRYTGPPITGWQQLDNNPATIGIVAAGANLYQLHKDGGIWKYTGTPLTGWQQLDNNPAATAICADDNNLYQLHKDGSIWRYTGPPLTGWLKLDNNPAATAIVSANENLYQLHKDGSIWRYTGPPLTGWQRLDSNPAAVAIAADVNDLYELHNTGRIWKYVGPPITGWQQLDSNPATTAIAAGGGIPYQLHKDGSIWKLL